MGVDLTVLVVTQDRLEGRCLQTLLSSIIFVDSVRVCNDLHQGVELLATLSAPYALACLVIDTRVYEESSASDAVSRLLSANPSKLVPLLLHYSATLRDGVIRARIAAVKGFANRFEGNRRESQWVRKLVAEVEAYLAGHRFLSEIDLLNQTSARQDFPIHPSITSEFHALKQLFRAAQRSKANIDAHIAGRFIFSSQVGENRHSLALRDFHVKTFEKCYSVSRSFNGPFEFRWMDRSLVDPDRFKLYRLALSTLLVECLTGLASFRGEHSVAFQVPTNFLVYFLASDRTGGGNQRDMQRLRRDLPFIDISDDPITLVFPTDVEDKFFSFPQLRRIVKHELMHLFNYADSGGVQIDSPWFDEAMANWYALRDSSESPPRVSADRALTSLENRYAGLAFARFMEASFGRHSILRVWQSQDRSIIAAAAKIGCIGVQELLLSFFEWAFRSDVYEEVNATAVFEFELAPLSCQVIKLREDVLEVEMSNGCWPENGEVHALCFSATKALVGIFNIQRTTHLPEPQRYSHLAVVNLVDSLTSDQSAHLSVHLRALSLSAGA